MLISYNLTNQLIFNFIELRGFMNSKAVTKVLSEIYALNRKSTKLSVLQKISKNINKFSGVQFIEFVKRLHNHPLASEIFNSVIDDPKLIFSNTTIRINKIENEFIWFENIFLNNSSHINLFLEKQNEVDIAILNNNPNYAIEVIDAIEQKLGYSMWSIEYKTHIKKELLGISSVDYLTTINTDIGTTFDFFIQQLIFKSESKNIYSFIDNLLAHIDLMRLTENDSKRISINFADFFATYFMPVEFDINRNINSRSISSFLNFPIIDQYNMFKKYMLDKKSLNGFLNDSEKEHIKNLLSFITDNELNNLLLNDVNMSDINNQFMDVIKLYTNSDYEATKDEINLLLTKTSDAAVFIELYAKNNIYLNKDDLGSTLFNKLADNFKNIVSLKDSDDSINFIEKITVKFNFSSWSYPLLYQLYSLINSTKHKKEFSKKNMIIMGNNITPLSSIDFSYKKLYDLLNINIQTLPYFRSIKTVEIGTFNRYEEIEDFYKKYESNSVIKIDYLKSKANTLIYHDKLLECASFLVDNYLDNELCHYFLPFENLFNKIEKNGFSNITIDIPILYDIYYKKINNEKGEERSEFYEDFVSEFGTYKPSEIYKNRDSLNKKEFYFLKYIAIPSIMDISSEFEGSIDLKKERLEVLNIIDTLCEDNNDVSIERNNLFDELVFEKLKASFNSSKIYVDVESLKVDKEYEYKRLYDIFIASKLLYDVDNDNDTQVDIDSDEIESDFMTLKNSKNEHVLMPVSDLSDITVQIYKQLIEDFVKNEDYGLDKYLSTEIRHDVFFTQLRSSIERHKLLTEIGMDDLYEENKYWFAEYQIVKKTILDKIDYRLKNFSKIIDFTIKDANNWFNVIEITNQKNSGMFDYLATYERLKKFKYLLLKVDNFNDFFDVILSFMWNITYENTEKIKKRLEEELKENIIKMIDTLYTDITVLSGTIAMHKLFDFISLARGGVIEEIDNVSGWLNRIEDDNKDYSIVSIIKECTNMFKLTFVNKKVDIQYINIDMLEINLSYLEARAVMNSIFIALDNVIKYGTQEDDNSYLVKIESDSKHGVGTIFNIRNKFNTDIDLKVFKMDLKDNISNKYQKLSKKEGGTGLHKINNLLTNVSDKFFMDIDIDNNLNEKEFIVIIGVKYEHANS